MHIYMVVTLKKKINQFGFCSVEPDQVAFFEGESSGWGMCCILTIKTQFLQLMENLNSAKDLYQ